VNSKIKFDNLNDEYFNLKEPTTKIKASDPDNENVLREFLNFMEEVDIGATLFETTEDFDEFKPLELKSDKPHRKDPCK